MYSMHRFGPNRPMCSNNRQFSTIGVAKNQPEEMKLKPEYLGNEHFKFLNNFGLQSQFISDKKFIDINHVDDHHPRNANQRVSITPSAPNLLEPHQTPNRQKSEPPVNPTTKELNMRNFNQTDNLQSSQHEPQTGLATPKHKKKRSQCDKAPQKSHPKKSKRQKNYQKQSKRESDRNVIRGSPRKHRNPKSWHKQSLQMEFMDVDDGSYSPSEQSLESPSIYTFSLPEVQSICVEGNLSVEHEQGSPKEGAFRPRLPSECESEDSFIVFEDRSKSFDLEDSEESSDGDCESSSEESDEGGGSTPCTQAAWRLGTLSPSKKVRFAVGDNLCKVHPMIRWSFAYQRAREGNWEQVARDRQRFKDRVTDLQPVLSVVLQEAHRSRIFDERFRPIDN